MHSEHYGSITPEEVKICISEFKKNTPSGPDLKIQTFHEIAAILNKWWGHSILESVKECRTALILETVEELKNSSNWQPITTGNLCIRLYAKIWDKWLRRKINLNIRQKWFVPVDGCFENVKTLQKLIKNQCLRRKEYNTVFVDLAKAFDTVYHKSIINSLKRR